MEENNEMEVERAIEEIDKSKIDRLLKKVILLERNNLKTKLNNDLQMIKMIKKAIEEEVACY